MSDITIKVENLSKLYQLGEVGTGTISHDLNRWWARVKGKEDPYAKIGQINDRNKKAKSDFVWVLNDINFEVKQGEVLGIIGRNGAGKSTLLKILSKITRPTKGKIYTKGRIASLLEVGTGFHPEMTGKENIYLNGAILGMRKWEIDQKFDEIVDFAGVEAYIDTPVKRYSSGMYVRLAFAVAAHLESEVLIIDEVLAVGDVEFQKKCLGKMGDVSKSDGRTILFVNHNMSAIQSICKTGIILENGLTHFIGDANEAISKYQLSLRSQNVDSLKKFKISPTSIDKKNENDLDVVSGRPFTLYFNIFSEYSFAKVSFYFILEDEDGKVIIHFRNDSFEINSGMREYKLMFDSLPLRSGSYVALFKVINSTSSLLGRYLSDYFTINITSSANLHTSAGLIVCEIALENG